MAQLRALPERHGDSPLSYAKHDIYFGSFERRTETRELDDIDLISCMHAEGSSYFKMGELVTIPVRDGTSNPRL